MPTEIDVLVASEYSSRDALEKYITEVYGGTPEPKSAEIDGTSEELRALNLSHGDIVWGVVAVATDYIAQVTSTVPERGEVFKSKINGVTI